MTVWFKNSSGDIIPPHGGLLVESVILNEIERDNILERIQNSPKLGLNEFQIADLECIVTGVYSPLTGFMVNSDYSDVINNMRLSNRVLWPIPVTLDVDKAFADQIKINDEINLTWKNSSIGVLKISDIYTPNKQLEALKVYGTDDIAHPGVAHLMTKKNVYLGGKVIQIGNFPQRNYGQYHLTPKQTRDFFLSKKWTSIVAFQTRNPIHRAHEYLQKIALEVIDGLLVHPLVGTPSKEDIPFQVRMESYITILNSYYPKDRTILGIYPAYMRYAGPREALLHAISRQNYGCTHIIIGRDHAGIGNYYGPYDAQEIFDQISDNDLLIRPYKLECAFYCTICKQMATKRTCPHGSEAHCHLSGTNVRQMLKEKRMLPEEYTRPEVALLLNNAVNGTLQTLDQKGVTLLFTGLSSAGKTTISKAVVQDLKKRGYLIERLDGDVVRQHLTADLGFTKEDRDKNIRRIGYVAHLLTRNNIIVLMANIAPYRAIRDEIRQLIGNFLEIYVKCPMEECEKRDIKGLYRKARDGIIKNFTGISDPYEEPTNPELILETHKQSVEECKNKVINLLVEHRYIKLN
ncbi:MAG: sulfate adenylyltransferase [Candidatus Lokiarchaeota archaeon]|nr:sulfate adenylyltransferase [Candidatus Lokiarchaeota archaeon]